MMHNWTKKITTTNEDEKKIQINIKNILSMVILYVEKLSMAYNVG